jgi:hypothetical protein
MGQVLGQNLTTAALSASTSALLLHLPLRLRLVLAEGEETNLPWIIKTCMDEGYAIDYHGLNKALTLTLSEAKIVQLQEKTRLAQQRIRSEMQHQLTKARQDAQDLEKEVEHLASDLSNHHRRTSVILVGPWNGGLRQALVNDVLNGEPNQIALEDGEEANLHWIIKTCAEEGFSVTSYDHYTKRLQLQLTDQRVAIRCRKRDELTEKKKKLETLRQQVRYLEESFLMSAPCTIGKEC